MFFKITDGKLDSGYKKREISVEEEKEILTFLKSYKNYSPPKKNVLAEYIYKAKGVSRSMNQFAEDTGIGKASLSRMVNQNIGRSLKAETLIAIYLERSNPDDYQLLSDMAIANGMKRDSQESYMTPEEQTKKHSHMSYMMPEDQTKKEEDHRKTEMRSAIANDLCSAPFSIEKIFKTAGHSYVGSSTYISVNYGDMLVKLNGENKTLWFIFLYPQLLPNSSDITGKMIAETVAKVFNDISGWLILDGWKDGLDKVKISCAFLDKSLCKGFLNSFAEAKIKTEISAILMDPEKCYVIAERWVNGTYCKMTEETVFNYVDDAELDGELENLI